MARKRVEKNISYDDVKKLYYVTLYYGKNEDGKSIKKYQTHKKLSEARKALKEHDADKTKGLLVMPNETTLNDWLNDWLDNNIAPYRAETTVYGYRKIIDNHIANAIGNQKLQQLKPLQIQKYYTMLIKDKNLSPNTVRKHHDLLHTSLKAAVKQEVILRNPIDYVEPPKVKKPEVEFYSSEQVRMLLAVVRGQWLEIVITLAIYFGLRRGEILGLKWDNVDFENKKIYIKESRTIAGKNIVEKDPKNNSSIRVLHMPDEVYNTLLEEKEKQTEYKDFLGGEYSDTGFVVVRDDGKPYRPNYISSAFKEFLEKNNLPIIKLHGLRHTFAALANKQGATNYDISKMLGHNSTATTTEIYMHTFDDTHREGIERVADGLRGE